MPKLALHDFMNQRIYMLKQLHSVLDTSGIESHEQFRDIMSATFDFCGLEIKSIAGDLGYNVSSVHRWAAGVTTPHKSLWPQIALSIKKIAQSEIDIIKSSTH
ncbi:hypothetical protein NBRC116602_24900 [Hyphomicrobiales bacterium 4NK60-0047b]